MIEYVYSDTPISVARLRGGDHDEDVYVGIGVHAHGPVTIDTDGSVLGMSGDGAVLYGPPEDVREWLVATLAQLDHVIGTCPECGHPYDPDAGETW